MELHHARVTGYSKLTIVQKKEIVEKMESEIAYTNRKAAEEYKVAKSAITYIMKNKDKILRVFDAQSGGRSLHDFDEAIIRRVKELSTAGLVPTMKSICEIANQIATETGKLENFGKGPGRWKANKGWYSRFATRVNVGYLITGTSPEDSADVKPGKLSIPIVGDVQYPTLAEDGSDSRKREQIQASTHSIEATEALDPANGPINKFPKY